MPFVQLQFRRGTAQQWTAANPLLAVGEMAIESDTELFKIGDGVLLWNALPYGGLRGPTGATGRRRCARPAVRACGGRHRLRAGAARQV
jgi:hypothetical protein